MTTHEVPSDSEWLCRLLCLLPSRKLQELLEAVVTVGVRLVVTKVVSDPLRYAHVRATNPRASNRSTPKITDHLARSMPTTAFTRIAPMAMGIMYFQPMFINWS